LDADHPNTGVNFACLFTIVAIALGVGFYNASAILRELLEKAQAAQATPAARAT